MDLALRVGRRLPRPAARKAERAGGPDARTVARAVRGACLRGHRAGRRARGSKIRGAWLAGEEYVPDQRGAWLVAVSWRDCHYLGTGAFARTRRAARCRFVWELQVVSGCLPYAGVRRPLRTGCAEMHLLSHD